MSQTPPSKKTISPVIGAGGIIPAVPENMALLKLIDNTPVLSPEELHTLAVSYQKVVSNSGLGNRLAFIALNTIFKYHQQQLAAPSQSVGTDLTWEEWACCVLRGGKNCNVTCPQPFPFIFVPVVKRVHYAELELLVEVTQQDIDEKTYAILGVSPSKLEA